MAVKDAGQKYALRVVVTATLPNGEHAPIGAVYLTDGKKPQLVLKPKDGITPKAQELLSGLLVNPITVGDQQIDPQTQPRDWIEEAYKEYSGGHFNVSRVQTPKAAA